MITKAQKVSELYKKNKKGLTSREADIVRKYYGLGGDFRWTLNELGEKYDITRERIRQIKASALIKIKLT